MSGAGGAQFFPRVSVSLDSDNHMEFSSLTRPNTSKLGDAHYRTFLRAHLATAVGPAVQTDKEFTPLKRQRAVDAVA